jgi:anti-sigma factor RsiW
MDCYEFQDKISAYIEKELTLSDVNRFDQHLESCRICAVAYIGVKSAVRAVRGSKRISVSTGFNDRLIGRLEREKVKPVRKISGLGRGRRIFGYKPQYAFASLAAVVLIVVLTIGILPDGDDNINFNPLPLSTQQNVNDTIQPAMRGGAPAAPTLVSEEPEEDSLAAPKDKTLSTPLDFREKIQLVKDKKK